MLLINWRMRSSFDGVAIDVPRSPATTSLQLQSPHDSGWLRRKTCVSCASKFGDVLGQFIPLQLRTGLQPRIALVEV